MSHCDSHCAHALKLEFVNEKYRDVLSQLELLSADNNALREQLNSLNSRMLQDPVKYLKLCEELTKERNELKRDLTESQNEVMQVLSERGSVLKENQNLSDKNDALRKELEKILKSRDDYIKECESLREKLEVMRSRSEFLQSNDDLFSSKDKMTFLSLEVANQEIEKLKKLHDKVKSEVAKAHQDSEIAKGRRDWAIHEREKIVQERDSVRNLCDELRKERDTATSKLLAAIRDKDEAVRKIEQLNEKIDALSNAKKAAEAQERNQRMDTEDEIEVAVSHMMFNADLGITLDCGNEDSDYNGNNLYPQVVYVESNSIFYGKLHTNDFIHCINGIDCSTLSQRMLFKTIRTSAPTCKMLIKRSKPVLKGIYNVQLSLKNNPNHGLAFDTGIYISDIEPNSVAYYEPMLHVGDRVLQINEKSVNVNELSQLIMNSEKLSLKVIKDGQSSNSATSLNRGWSKMINSSTQTDQRSMESNFLPMPFTPQVSLQEQEMLNNSISSSPNSSKSASSKLSGMFQKIRDKISNSTRDNQENIAIAVLDSVLDSQDSLDTAAAQEKSSKRNKHKKDIAKSWPRAAAIMHDHDPGKSHSGTVVFNRKKDRPRLYLIPTDDQPNDQMERKNSMPEKMTAEQQKAINTFFSPPPPVPQSRNSNRNSNPLPLYAQSSIMRSSIPPRSTLPGSGTKSPPTMHTIYEPTVKSFNMNRLSLNLSSNSSSNKSSHFQHNSFIPIKTSNSIESKSPIDLAAKDDVLDFTTSQKMKKYFSNYSSSKYECVSDNENFSSSGGVSQQDSLNNASIGTIPSHMRIQSIGSPNRMQGSPSGLYSNSYLANRYASPPPIPPNDIISPSHDLNMSSSLHNSHNSSIDYSFTSKARSQLSREEMSAFHGVGSYQESGTFPRKKAMRVPPSSQVIAAPPKPMKISNNSLDYCGTDRASPMPTFQIQIVKPGRNTNINKRNSMPDYNMGSYKPNIGEIRRVHIDKSEKPLGISIRCRNNRGVFVSHVGENSIASKVGLQIGDQLLEFCGINMRLATYDLAAKFLRQCGNSITMLVQYNPEKFEELSTSDENLSRSDDSTPQNSPKVTRSVMSSDSMQNIRMSSLPPQESSHSTGTLKTQRNPMMTPITQVKSASIVSQSSSSQLQHMMAGNSSTLGKEQPRMIYFETRKNPNLGVSLLGGNAYGIFIHSVQKDSIADNVGLRVSDQILEYNNTDLRHATAEEAAFELAKPADKVTAMVQYNIQKFNSIKDKPGDSFYIRVGFDRNSESKTELTFSKDDVLYVDNTMFRGVSGQWRAWKLDELGCRMQCGVIPSQMKVDEELRLLGDSADGDTSSSRRSSTSARRSFFKRIKPQRGSSRDSKELASFSNTHLSLYLEPPMNDESPVSYQRVERLEYKYRPVLVIGALSEMVVDKLIIDFPEQFHRCIVNQMKCSKEEIEMRLNNNSIIEYHQRRGSLFECVSLQAVKDNKQSHCILDVNLSAVERLHRNQIYPIVLLLRFKSAKQIKEIKDSRYGTDKLSAKQAKEMYEHALKLESEYRQYISVVIQGVNITHMSTQIKAAVDVEQKKILWIARNF